MILTEQPRYWFYPDVADNLAQPEEEQLAVEIIRPTGFQFKEFQSVVSGREFYQNDQPVDADGNPRKVGAFKKVWTEIRINADIILRTCVGEIRNLAVRDAEGGAERKIADGRELAECRAYGVDGIVSAICAEVRADIPSEAKKKNIG
ncbi:MAG: hypothetical protein K2H09_07925 [Treponemataceae bacterium]|nr:hypothetical protein [Treponemataceae bacterium]